MEETPSGSWKACKDILIHEKFDNFEEFLKKYFEIIEDNYELTIKGSNVKTSYRLYR